MDKYSDSTKRKLRNHFHAILERAQIESRYCCTAALTRAFWFWLYTVKTRAIDLRTTLIFASFDAAPPVTLLTRSWASSFLRSSNLFKRASLFSWRSSWALSFPYTTMFKTIIEEAQEQTNMKKKEEKKRCKNVENKKGQKDGGKNKDILNRNKKYTANTRTQKWMIMEERECSTGNLRRATCFARMRMNFWGLEV